MSKDHKPETIGADHPRSAEELAYLVNKRHLDPFDLARYYKAKTKAVFKDLNSHVFYEEDVIDRQVEVLVQRLDQGVDLPLAGIPILVKDNICTEGIPTTAGSKMLKNYRPPEDAFVVQKIREAGGIIFGKANCDEFAMGSSNENSFFGAVSNPWDLSCVPGGSSGGSAAAVAASMVPLSLGSDTGGSVRQPAAMCGVVGLKPTYGYVSRRGLIAYASSLDQIGPIGTNVRDLALVLSVIGESDPLDGTSTQGPRPSFKKLVESNSSRKQLRIGLVEEFMGEGISGDVKNSILESVEILKRRGFIVENVSLPSLKYSLAAYYIIATAEASSNLARYDGVRYGYRSPLKHKSLDDLYLHSRSEGLSLEVKKRIMLGTFVLSHGYYDAYYGKANKVRAAISRDFQVVFQNYDLLIGPTSPVTAFPKGEKINDALSMYLLDVCTIAANLAGIPSISLPCSLDQKKLPIGLQILGNKFQEPTLFYLAQIIEKDLGFSTKFKPLLQSSKDNKSDYL